MVYSTCREKWAKFNKELGPCIRRFYLDPINNALFADTVAEEDVLNLPNLQHFDFELGSACSAKMARKFFFSSPRLRSIVCTVSQNWETDEDTCIDPPAPLVDFFKTSASQVMAREQLTHFELVTFHPHLWDGLRAPVAAFLSSFPALKVLKADLKLMAPDFVKALSGLKQLRIIEPIADLEVEAQCRDWKPLREIVTPSDTGAEAFPALRELGLYSSLCKIQRFLSETPGAWSITDLDIQVDRNPSREELALFLQFIGTHCIKLQTLRLALVRSTSKEQLDSLYYRLNGTLLEPLGALEELEELHIDPAPPLSLTDKDIVDMSTFWSRLRMLVIMPHEHFPTTTDSPNLATLFLLADRVPSLVHLNVPFAESIPARLVGDPIENLEALVERIHSTAIDAWCDANIFTGSQDSMEDDDAEFSPAGSQHTEMGDTFDYTVDSQDSMAGFVPWSLQSKEAIERELSDSQKTEVAPKDVRWNKYHDTFEKIDEDDITPMSSFQEDQRAQRRRLGDAVELLLPHVPGFKSVVVKGVQDVRVVRNSGEKLRIVGRRTAGRVYKRDRAEVQVEDQAQVEDLAEAEAESLSRLSSMAEVEMILG